ncbi:MAG: serine/threonine-protein kinase [Pirellulaceae bacterium]|nr:serine/threonine-protein kinase [Pirellulaceae bacterium]
MVVSKQSPFVRSALLSGQVSQAQVDDAINRVRESGGLSALPAVEVGDERLADELTKMGILTPYQAAQLRQGNTRLNLGPYVIVDFLGQGGMGQVFVALHQMMERKVAIKVLPQSKSTNDSIANFKREIQTQAKLDHRNLVRAYDAGHDGNVYFLVTEYVPGTDLRRLVRSRGPLTMKQGASVITQAALGIEYAHSQGLIHRDVKPGNLLVTPEGAVKVSDLGLAGFLDEGQNDPRAGKIVGTADYLAPEKITTPLDVAPVSDIYSLGCTLYYAITGKVPFPGGTTRDKARRHCEETPWHPRKFNPDISDEFVDLIADMMEKDPTQRLGTARDVVQRLEPWADAVAPLPHPTMTKSPWQPPPVPSGREETVEDLSELARDVAEDSQDGGGPTGSEELSGTSQSTDGVSGQDTLGPSDQLVVPMPPPAPIREKKTDVTASIIKALAIAIPIAFVAGGLITFLFMEFVQ